MRARLLISVLVVLGLSYGLVEGWRYSVRRARHYVEEQLLYGPGLSHTEVSRSSHTFDLAGAHLLTIGNEFGSVEVNPGGPEVSVERVVHVLSDTPELRARAARFSLVGRREADGGYMIEVRGDRERPPIRVDLVASVPTEIALELLLSAGRARVTGIRGPVAVATSSGDVEVWGARQGTAANTRSGAITLRDLRGPVAAAASSGRIRAQGVRGATSVRTTSGSVELRDVEGACSVSTARGAVRLTDLRGGDIRTSSTAGSIRIMLAQPFSDRMEVSTTSGSVTIGVPAGSDCRVDATSASGHVTNRLPAPRAGAGAGRIEVRTVSGSITVGNPPEV